MTIALAAYGPNAAIAVYRGVLAAEVLGRGEIGGFAVYSVLDDQGKHHQYCCQNGGIAAVGCSTAHQSAQCAAVISSGPDRPEPLSQFLVGRSGLGLVTGHRLPSREDSAEQPVNLATLELMAQGSSVSDAINASLERNPELDVGLLAVTPGGPLASGNSARVCRRNDLLGASRMEDARGYAPLGNSIYAAPTVALDRVIGAIMWDCLTGNAGPFFIAELVGSVPLRRSDTDRIELDADNRVVRIDAAEPNIDQGFAGVTVIHSGASVWQGGRCIGRSMSEVLAKVTGNRAGVDALQSRFVVERS